MGVGLIHTVSCKELELICAFLGAGGLFIGSGSRGSHRRLALC